MNDESSLTSQEKPRVGPLSSTRPRVTFDMVLKELKRRSFGVLSTVTRDNRSHSAGVFYSVSPYARPLEIYLMTRTKLKKARNIMNNPNVSFVVPLRRRLLTFVPPACIEFQGHAETVDWKDETGVTAFKTSFMGRTISKAYDEMYLQGDTSICFLKITPDPTIFTYGVGVSIWEMRRHMEIGFAKVEVPLEYRKPEKRSSDEV